MKIINRDKQNDQSKSLSVPQKSSFKSSSKIDSILKLHRSDYQNGRYRYMLYRFLSDNIPVVNSCLNSWIRLSAAPGKFIPTGEDSKASRTCLENLNNKIYRGPSGNNGSLITFLSELFMMLYRDGLFGGFLTVKPNGEGIDRFIPLDPSDIISSDNRLYLELDDSRIELNRPDFYFIPYNGDRTQPLGRSIFQTIPFVSYIEQQLIDDMRRSSHNAGFHKLHVKITPPERSGGESEQAYVDRINSYFDSTVNMIKSCDIEDNPVTWDNISIETIGPQNVRTVTNSWFLNHRAMIEEICAGTNLAPFLLGYSFGATATWASLKFDIVMRQVKSVQSEVAALLQWIGNVELALKGFKTGCRFEFDNTLTYRETEQSQVNSQKVDSLLKLYQNGLIDEARAKEIAGGIISAI